MAVNQRGWFLGLALAVSTAAVAFQPSGVVHAARASAPIELDGHLEEPEWVQAPVYSQFVESFPNEGQPASLRTEVRVLYDDANLYVGVTCFDPDPGRIGRQLGRRDSSPSSDRVTLFIDSEHDRRTAYAFSVNAAGVLKDSLLFGDVNQDDNWDAVWAAEPAMLPNGWSAEFVIPLNILRFPDQPQQTWGFMVQREVLRTHQTLMSVLVPRDANARVSRFGELVGLKNLHPKMDLELTPHALARLGFDPQYSDPSTPHPRLFNPSGDVGVDVRASLTRALTLNATVNPDFGEVEPDQVILNLQNTEPFFPEKRPFFTEGLDLFQPVGAEFGPPHQLFYSRRIGLDAPILGAVKVTGEVGPGLDLGILDGLVMGADNPSLAPLYYSGLAADPAVLHAYESQPDRRFQLHPEEPFHFGLNSGLPPVRPVTTNYFALVARQQVAANSNVGVTFTSAEPLAAACVPSDFNVPPVSSSVTPSPYSADLCDAFGGNAGALDWNFKTPDGQYGVIGTLDGSQKVHGPPDGETLLDGTVLKPGSAGAGGYVWAGKMGGEPWRLLGMYQFASPRLDLNDVGFLPSQNQQKFGAALQFVKPTGLGKLRNLQLTLSQEAYFTTDGTWMSRGNYSHLNLVMQLPGYQMVGANAGYDHPNFDVREIHYYGVPFERPNDFNGSIWAASDPNRPFYSDGFVFAYRGVPLPSSPAQTGYGFGTNTVWRPHPRLETQFQTNFQYTPQGARYVDNLSVGQGTQFIFGQQFPGVLSLTLRQQLVITPRMTLQAYAQLFSDYAHYGPFYAATRNLDDSMHGHEPIELTELTPTVYGGDPDFHDTVLNMNVVFRWEYRLGSTLFLVYSRSQSQFPATVGTNIANPWPSKLLAGPASDMLLVKWSYWWSA